MDYFSSMYIDNELDLDEKVLFLEKIRAEGQFYEETIALLEQERLLRTQPEKLLALGETRFRYSLQTRMRNLFRPIIYVGTGFALATLLLFSQRTVSTDPVSPATRFVIFEPAASRVELTGSFNDWQRVAMKQNGATGYWELNLHLPYGEHRFSYILDGTRRMADPTMPIREQDDFGGENSVLKIHFPDPTLIHDSRLQSQDRTSQSIQDRYHGIT